MCGLLQGLHLSRLAGNAGAKNTLHAGCVTSLDSLNLHTNCTEQGPAAHLVGHIVGGGVSIVASAVRSLLRLVARLFGAAEQRVRDAAEEAARLLLNLRQGPRI